MPDLSQISVIILAGGESRRMGGEDKGLTVYQGKPLIEHVLSRLPAGLQHIAISANRNQYRYQHYGEVFEDKEFVLHGPLSGVLEAMKHCHSNYLLCLPCDTPHLPHELIPRLLAALQTEQVDVAIAASKTRSHYVISLIKCSLEDGLREFLASGQRRVGSWLQQQSYC
ncbi:MAG: molybdenum cofactor guanylyltransferase, partial [Gammaproteobacteria bacterium]|nr:molybdenum cofactor guanylyltransferase [Gammaproteobacteria bacterium]